MKRKLIDLPDDVFTRLSAKARNEGTNLNNYIENLLQNDSARLEMPGTGYRFTMEREPTEPELASVMRDAARMAEQENKAAEQRYFEEMKKAPECRYSLNIGSITFIFAPAYKNGV